MATQVKDHPFIICERYFPSRRNKKFKEKFRNKVNGLLISYIKCETGISEEINMIRAFVAVFHYFFLIDKCYKKYINDSSNNKHIYLLEENNLKSMYNFCLDKMKEIVELFADFYYSEEEEDLNDFYKFFLNRADTIFKMLIEYYKNYFKKSERAKPIKEDLENFYTKSVTFYEILMKNYNFDDNIHKTIKENYFDTKNKINDIKEKVPLIDEGYFAILIQLIRAITRTLLNIYICKKEIANESKVQKEVILVQ